MAPTTSSTISVSTSLDLLVPGDGTEGAESTTTTTAPGVVTRNDGLSDQQLLAIVVGGLVLMALAVTVLLWRYWKATGPLAVAVPHEGSGGSDGDRGGNSSP